MLTPTRITPAQIETKLDRILLKVQKPGRYVGGELNSIVKDWDSIETKVAFVFPDIYDIGVSNVGLKILYDQVNQRDDALAERAYSPWFDMEVLMREHGIPLYALESKRPLACFDLIGFTLPYETLYTNALNVLDLAGIPVRSLERDETHRAPWRRPCNLTASWPSLRLPRSSSTSGWGSASARSAASAASPPRR